MEGVEVEMYSNALGVVRTELGLDTICVILIYLSHISPYGVLAISFVLTRLKFSADSLGSIIYAFSL